MSTVCPRISIHDLLSTTTIREHAAIKLFGLDLTTNEYKFAKAIAEVVKKLSRVSLAKESNEMELCSRYVDPFLCNYKASNGKQTLVFGKAKPVHQGSNHYSVCRDLLCVLIFCIVMGLQIVDRTITFYILVLPSSGLYIMHELAKIKIPDCLNDLPKLVTDISDVLLVLDIFDRICIPSVDCPHPKRHRPTISSSIFDQLFSTYQNRKRPCALNQHHN
ncbi:hypothetical protein CLU79DRAFT_806659 [Phycomyces nitens]|nr:hypothetical protein CLU79DRAFT_806659 [Phycomyces nitens]